MRPEDDTLAERKSKTSIRKMLTAPHFQDRGQEENWMLKDPHEKCMNLNSFCSYFSREINYETGSC